MKTFEEAYPGGKEIAAAPIADEGLTSPVRQLVREYGGTCYGGGIYRIWSGDEARHWTAIVRRCFPAESAGVEAFGRDWQGNVFGYRDGAEPGVLLFQPGTGDVFEVADSLERFHDEELVEHAEEALSLSLWNEWRANSPAPGRAQCVAYRHPVFLGGDVAAENLVLADLEVYWELMGQLLGQVRALPEGTPIEHVNPDALD